VSQPDVEFPMHTQRKYPPGTPNPNPQRPLHALSTPNSKPQPPSFHPQPPTPNPQLPTPNLRPPILSGRVLVINTRAQRKILHIWIILVIVKQYDRIDGPTDFFSQILAATRPGDPVAARPHVVEDPVHGQPHRQHRSRMLQEYLSHKIKSPNACRRRSDLKESMAFISSLTP
jgi:hypothetical protein